MPIVGMNIRKIEAIKHQNIEGKVFVGQKPVIKDIREKKIDALDKNALEIEYEYTFEYKSTDRKKTFATIGFHGDALYMVAKGEEISTIVEAWKKEKRIPTQIFVFVVNGIMKRSMARAMLLADELNIPSPIPTPKVKVTPKEKTIDPARYIG